MNFLRQTAVTTNGESLFEIDRALHQLELTTDALLATEVADFAALCEALDDRADAITKLALAAEGTPSGQAPLDALERLTSILVRGDAATRRLLGNRLQMTVGLTNLHAVTTNFR